MSRHISFLLIGFLLLGLLGCSEDNGSPPCVPTSITMKINGQLHTFQALGRGVNLTADGYVLDLNFYSNTPEYGEENISMSLPYRKKGNDIIVEFIYSHAQNGVLTYDDFINAEADSKVLTNSRFCFNATFSGKVTNATYQIIITEAQLKYEYETPFDAS